jgi:hypothetical protein
MKITIAIITLVVSSCCGGIAYDGRFATYSIDKDGNIVIHPKIHNAK